MALAINPEHVGALNNLGIVLMRQGQLDAAYRNFSRALEINPGYEEARRNLEDLEQKRSGPVVRGQ
jgi:lipoprotein NlpI